MNYRHSYHAGSASDVFKHIVLVALLQALHKKDKPFCYLETHAGQPLYELNNKEFQDGIAKLWGQPVTGLIQDYLQIIQQHNPTKTLSYYPGSATIAHSLLRPGDRMILSELQPTVVTALKQAFKQAVYAQDGFTTLKACLPPKERRGLVLIDPCYEAPDEWKQLVPHIVAAWKRWQTGIYAIWYPIKLNAVVNKFHADLKRSGIPNILITEFCPWPSDIDQRLSGSGLAIINPPFQLENTLKTTLPALLTLLKQHSKATSRIFML